MENQKEPWTEWTRRKCRNSKIYKKQKNGLARVHDVDGWRENAQKNIRMEASRLENQRKTKEKMDWRRWGIYPDDGNKRVEKMSKERTEWKKITEKAKTHSGL